MLISVYFKRFLVKQSETDLIHVKINLQIIMSEQAIDHLPIQVDTENKNSTLNERRTWFDAEHSEIVEKYGKEIPKPSEDLRICLVIPAISELENLHFWKLAESLLKQKDASSFEVLYILNVPSEYYKKINGNLDDFDKIKKSSRLDVETMQKRIDENKTHLRILSLLNQIRLGNQDLQDVVEQNRDLELEDWQWDLLKKLADKKVRIHGIDATSENSSLEFDYNKGPIGITRNIGVHIAYDRLPANGYIDFIDGDCSLPRSYFSALSKAAETDPSFILKPHESQIFEIPREIEEESDSAKKLSLLVKFVRQHAIYAQFSKGVNEIHQLCIDRDPQQTNRVHVGGPLLALRRNYIRDVGGYDISESDEDFRFAAKTVLGTNKFSISKKPVFIFDRSRPDSTDGYGKVALDEDVIDDIFNNDSTLDERSKKFSVVSRAQMLCLNEALENNDELSTQYVENRRREYVKQRKTKDQVRYKVFQIIEDSQNRSTSERVSDSLEDAYIASNQAWLDLVNAVQNVNHSKGNPNLTMQKLETVIPELLSSFPNEEPNYSIDEELKETNISRFAHIEEAAIDTLVDYLNQADDPSELTRRRKVVTDTLRAVNKKVMQLTE